MRPRNIWNFSRCPQAQNYGLARMARPLLSQVQSGQFTSMQPPIHAI